MTDERVQGYDPVRGEINVWHISPFDFDEFSMEKNKRKGDGNAIQGDGLYFAEHPYPRGPGGSYWHNLSKRFNYLQTRTSRVLFQARGNRAKAIDWLLNNAEEYLGKVNGSPGDKYCIQFAKLSLDGARLIREHRQLGPLIYDSTLKARPDQFMHFNKLVPIEKWEMLDPVLRDTMAARIADRGLLPFQYTGQGLMRFLNRIVPLRARDIMKDMGYIGVQYFDKWSPIKPGEKPPHNYAVWDNKIIYIKQKGDYYKHHKRPEGLRDD